MGTKSKRKGDSKNNIGKLGELPTPTRKGYTFTGWKIDNTTINDGDLTFSIPQERLIGNVRIYTSALGNPSAIYELK